MKNWNLEKIYQFIYKFNTIVVFIIILSIPWYFIFQKKKNKIHSTENEINISNTEEKTYFSLNKTRKIHGFSIITADLLAHNDELSLPDNLLNKYLLKEKDETSVQWELNDLLHRKHVNIMYIDTSNGKMWFLLPNNNSIIKDVKNLSVEGELLIFYLLRNNKNNDILIVSNKIGEKRIELFNGSFDLDDIVLISKNKIKIRYHDAVYSYEKIINGNNLKTVNFIKNKHGKELQSEI